VRTDILLLSALLLSPGLLLSVHAAVPDSSVADLAIPPQPLNQALSSFARRHGLQLVYISKVADGVQTHGAPAGLPLKETLQRLLEGTGVSYRFINDNTVTIFNPADNNGDVGSSAAGSAPRVAAIAGTTDRDNTAKMQSDSATAGTTTSAPDSSAADSQASAQSKQDQASKLPQVVVIGKVAKGFAAQSTSSATRTDTPLEDIPQSVTIISQDVMRSQQVQSVTDVLQNVSGVTLDGNGSPYIRGFQASVSANGLQDNTALMTPTGGVDTPIIGVQQVEVLKGPDSILAGSTAPGGIINVVLKAPQAEPYHEVLLQGGSFGDWLAGLDTTGPILPSDERLTYRFIASYEHADHNFGGYYGLSNLYLAPSIAWKSGGTQVVVSVTHTLQSIPVPPYTILLNGQPATAPSSPISSRSDRNTLDGTSVYYDLVQDLVDSWKFHSKASFDTGKFATDFYALEGVAGSQGFYIPESVEYKASGYNTDNNLAGSFKTGPLTHTILLGFSLQAAHPTEYVVLAAPVMASIYAPNLPPASSQPGPLFSQNLGITRGEQAYLQDQIAWGDRFHMLVSIAHDEASSQYYDQGKWLPNVGIVYRLVAGLSAFVSETRSFQAQANEVLANGGLPPPSGGQSTEVGMKLRLLDDKLSSSLAVFDTKVTNFVTFEPTAGGFVLNSGSDSRGIDADIQGRPAPGWNVIASLTYGYFRDLLVGFSQLPRVQGSFWSTYELQGGPLQGLGAGMGLFARTDYSLTSDTGAMTTLPHQASVNLSAFYHVKSWSATLGVKNALDHRLYADYAYNTMVNFQPGRTVTLTLAHTF
jgi:iron complex outermembrane recepter protein